jgi:hypothetical protein
MYPDSPMAQPPPPNKQIESVCARVKQKHLVKDDVDANNDEEAERRLTIRRVDIAEPRLKVGDIIKLRLSPDYVGLLLRSRHLSMINLHMLFQI